MDYDTVSTVTYKYELFKAHSTRHVTTTAAYLSYVPLGGNLKKAGWSNAKTFEQFHYYF